MLFDALVILSPTILAGTYLIGRDIKNAGHGHAVAARIWDDAEELTTGSSFSRNEPPVKRVEIPRSAGAEPSLDAVRDSAARSLDPDAPTFRSTRREPPLKAREPSSEVFHIDFDDEK